MLRHRRDSLTTLADRIVQLQQTIANSRIERRLDASHLELIDLQIAEMEARLSGWLRNLSDSQAAAPAPPPKRSVK